MKTIQSSINMEVDNKKIDDKKMIIREKSNIGHKIPDNKDDMSKLKKIPINNSGLFISDYYLKIVRE